MQPARAVANPDTVLGLSELLTIGGHGCALCAMQGPERFLKGVKNCAVNYLCYCSKDSDCGIGHVCAEGRVYTEFKVCRRKRFWFA